MKTTTINTTNDAACYLLGLDPTTTIELPGAGEIAPHDPVAVAVAKISEMSANEWASSQLRWEWTAAELVDALLIGHRVNSRTRTFTCADEARDFGLALRARGLEPLVRIIAARPAQYREIPDSAAAVVLIERAIEGGDDLGRRALDWARGSYWWAKSKSQLEDAVDCLELDLGDGASNGAASQAQARLFIRRLRAALSRVPAKRVEIAPETPAAWEIHWVDADPARARAALAALAAAAASLPRADRNSLCRSLGLEYWESASQLDTPIEKGCYIHLDTLPISGSHGEPLEFHRGYYGVPSLMTLDQIAAAENAVAEITAQNYWANRRGRAVPENKPHPNQLKRVSIGGLRRAVPENKPHPNPTTTQP